MNVNQPAAFGRLCVETIQMPVWNAPMTQPPSGGCVLKPRQRHQKVFWGLSQPPSGGCVLKPYCTVVLRFNDFPAAFGRLCVETTQAVCLPTFKAPAAFGRLCVETFGLSGFRFFAIASRLRAAVC